MKRFAKVPHFNSQRTSINPRIGKRGVGSDFRSKKGNLIQCTFIGNQVGAKNEKNGGNGKKKVFGTEF